MLETKNNHLKTLPKVIELALEEDRVVDDITSDLTIDNLAQCSFQINAREDLIFCGKKIIAEVFEQLKRLPKFHNYEIDIEYLFEDGDKVLKNQNIVIGNGSAKLILVAERVILNLIQHLSSIATNAKNYVETLDNPRIKILDTRKTLPYLRELQKYAVSCGGGYNHRFNLSDLILIKDNHIQSCGGIDGVLQRLKNFPHNLKVEIECDNFTQVMLAIKHSPNIIMLDNMGDQELQKSIQAIRQYNPKIMIEVSGGINIQNIKNYRDYDIDFISIGSLTSSIKAVDIGLDFL